LDSTATTSLSVSVVVGEQRLSVSERMPESRQPATVRVMGLFLVTKLWAMMVQALPHGRMSMKMGESVAITPAASQRKGSRSGRTGLRPAGSMARARHSSGCGRRVRACRPTVLHGVVVDDALQVLGVDALGHLRHLVVVDEAHRLGGAVR
jgi:hypothetical protein